jgi:ubiquinone/menaquinone biosynthesis C-methylase UbiE
MAIRRARARIVSVDLSSDSLALARRRVEAAGYGNVTFEVADVYQLPFDDESFDHVFVCFVLKHLRKPVEALRALDRVLRPGGSITVIEGDHGSWYCYPETRAAAWERGIADLYRATAAAGTFCYTFFKATAVK